MDESAAVLEEILAWTRAMAIPGVRATLEAALPTASERRVYELSDGERTTREIATQVGVGHNTVARWWRKWRALGVCVEAGQGRARRLVGLDDLGIPLKPPDQAR
jgi:hypothetical protein